MPAARRARPSVAATPTTVALAAVVAALVVWVVELVHFRDWIAHNDFAIFRIALERELAGDVRLVGAHSRLGVFHPGPLREWTFAIPYWVSGRRAAALPATALVLNAVWLGWTVVVARRLPGGAARVAAAAGVALVALALGENVASPWNPHLAIAPLHLACWATVATLAGSRRGVDVFGALVGASFAAQMHASALPVGAVLVTVTIASLASSAVRARRDADASDGSGRVPAIAVAVVLVLWSGPLLDLVVHGADANVFEMLRAASDGDRVGFVDALGDVSRLLWPATPLTGYAVRPSIELMEGFTPLWLAVVVVALLAAHRRRARSGLAAGLLAVAVVSVSSFVEPAFRYLFGPLQAVAVFVLLAAAAGTVELIPTPAFDAGHRRFVGVASGLAIAVVAIVVALAPADDHETAGRRALDIEPRVVAALAARPDWTTVEVTAVGQRRASIDAELADIALRAGLDVRSERFGLGVDPPVGDEPVLAVAMGDGLACLVAADDAERIVDGVVATTGDEVGVFAFDRGGPAAACLA